MRILDAFFLHIKSWSRTTLHVQGIGGNIWPNRFCTPALETWVVHHPGVSFFVDFICLEKY